MKVLLSWLREFCPTALGAEEVADVLTRQGVEVGAIERPWERLGGVVTARVLDVRDHPRADRLCVATVDAGGVERRVVVGVRNFLPGDEVPYAPPGATLPGFERTLERREIRGEMSEGMLCSPKELAISSDHSGILILTGSVHRAAPGTEVKGLLGLEDAVIDVEVFPNRPDLLSVVGVAREVAAATGDDFREQEPVLEEGDGKAAEVATVEVSDAERCPRYLARVIRDVRVAPSPLQAQIRLGAGGMRPLSNVVDATNYAMLETGQPMHPFDLSRLAGAGIVVRRAGDGERMTTLDGVERTLEGDDLVIADHERGVAVAGVMGAEVAEVDEGTRDVLLESAHFQPRGVLRTARRLGVRTEASVRFERGANPEAVAAAAARAAGLIAEWGGGTVLSGAVDVGEAPPRRWVSVRPARAGALLGVEVSREDARRSFERLRLPSEDRGDAVDVEVPGHRVDLEREADLIEEIARVHGYERIPSSLPGVRQAGGLERHQRARRRVQDSLAAAGLLETLSTSFVSSDAAGTTSVRIANPVSEEESFLRSALLPGLLVAAGRNAAHRVRSIRLFEVGHVFGAGPEEEERVAALFAGSASRGWPDPDREHDFFDARGAFEHLVDALGVEGWSMEAPAGPPYHPGRSARVLLAGRPIGEVGELHPTVVDRFDLVGRIVAFELRLAPLLEAASRETTYEEVSRFPPVHRDLAFVVDRGVSAGRLRGALEEAAGALLERAVLFDAFEGGPVPEGKVSLAFSVDFRAPDRTLTDEEVADRVRRIAERLAADLGAELRSG